MRGALAVTGAVALAVAGCTRVEVWRVETRIADEGSRIEVLAVFPPGADVWLSADPALERFFEAPEIRREGRWLAAERDGATRSRRWLVPSGTGARVLRYGFDLEAAAAALDDPWHAMRRGAVYLAPPSTWLLRASAPPPPGCEVSLCVVGAELDADDGAATFSSGLATPGRPAGGPHRFPARYLERLPLAVIGPHRTTTLHLDEGRITLVLVPERGRREARRLERWILARARALRRYLGRFPVPHALLVVSARQPGSDALGTTQGNGGASILLPRPPRSSRASLRGDWVLLHELLHLAFPQLPAAERWLAEGMPTYVEPLLQAREGWLEAREVWHRFLHGFASATGDSGARDREPALAGTPAPLYWRGALFFFLADVELRRRSKGRVSLDDALRGIVEVGGTIEAGWSRERLIEAADRATGDTVFRELMARMESTELAPTLERLWRELGVTLEGGAVVFDDGAPLAKLRASLTGG